MIKQTIGRFYLKNFSSNRFERIWKMAQIDFKKRYYNDKLGLFWALLNPVLQVAIYYFVFKHVMNREEDDFALFLFAGLVFWVTFMMGTKQGINIFRTKRYLIENIQLNKIDLFTSHCISVFLGFTFNLSAFILAALLYGIKMDVFYILWGLPVIVVLTFALIFGSSLALSTLSITLKDINHIWDFLLLCGFWTAGIFFPAEKIIAKLEILKYLNPFLGLVENARRIFIYNIPFNNNLLFINICQSLIVVFAGWFIFKKFSGKAIEKI